MVLVDMLIHLIEDDGALGSFLIEVGTTCPSLNEIFVLVLSLDILVVEGPSDANSKNELCIRVVVTKPLLGVQALR